MLFQLGFLCTAFLFSRSCLWGFLSLRFGDLCIKPVFLTNSPIGVLITKERSTWWCCFIAADRKHYDRNRVVSWIENWCEFRPTKLLENRVQNCFYGLNHPHLQYYEFRFAELETTGPSSILFNQPNKPYITLKKLESEVYHNLHLTLLLELP